MRRTRKALATLALALALVTATTAAAAATPPTGTQDQADPRQALYQSELERNLQLRTQAGNEAAAAHGLAAARKALYQSELEQTLARHRAAGAVAAQPAAKTDPTPPGSGVDVPATLLVGLVGGLVGGAAAMLGWTARLPSLSVASRTLVRQASRSDQARQQASRGCNARKESAVS